MAAIVPFVITVIVLAVSLLIISKLPIGVEVDSPAKALIGGAIIGILHAILGILPFGGTLAWLTLGLLPLITAIVVFGLAAFLVEGFRLKWGIWSAILGAITLAIINGILTKILTAVGLLG
ncbi:MAG: phage holin family protein [Leptolyngbyaceae cyanobacterium]